MKMADNNQFTWDALNNILKYSGAAMTGMKKAADAVIYYLDNDFQKVMSIYNQ